MKEIELTGKVIADEYAPGSKSAHTGVFLVVNRKKYKLKFKGGNPFHDPELDKYIGKKIRVSGLDAPHVFIITDTPEIIPPVKRKPAARKATPKKGKQ